MFAQSLWAFQILALKMLNRQLFTCWQSARKILTHKVRPHIFQKHILTSSLIAKKLLMWIIKKKHCKKKNPLQFAFQRSGTPSRPWTPRHERTNTPPWHRLFFPYQVRRLNVCQPFLKPFAVNRRAKRSFLAEEKDLLNLLQKGEATKSLSARRWLTLESLHSQRLKAERETFKANNKTTRSSDRYSHNKSLLCF